MGDRERAIGSEARTLLDSAGFDPDRSVLTGRQAEILVLRERGATQREIADELGTSRANVSSIESTARRNIANARETVAFADAIRSPVRIRVEAGTDLIDVPEQVYDACDEAGTKVAASAPALLKQLTDAAEEAVVDGTIAESLFIGVAADGEVTIRRSVGDDG